MNVDLGINKAEHNELLLKKLDRIRRKNQHSDLTIKVGSEEILVHKNIMSAGSDYFDAMLSHDNVESKSGIVDMQDVDVESVKLCINYIYIGEASVTGTLDKCEKLLHVACMMQLSILCDKIADFLQSQLSPQSFCNIKRIADKYDCKNLSEFCQIYASENLGMVAREAEFNSLDFDYISLLIGSTVVKHPEDSKLAIVLQWIKADIINRQKNLYGLMSKLDLGNISSTYLKFLLENERVFYESPECMKMLFLTQLSDADIESLTPESAHSSPRMANALLVLDTKSQSLQAFVAEKKVWTKLQSLPEFMLYNRFAIVILTGFLYVLMDTKVYRLNLTSRKPSWTIMRSMKHKHGCNIRAAIYNNCIYVTGDGRMEKYNPKDYGWQDVNCNRTPVTSCALASAFGFLYTIGGEENDENEKDCENEDDDENNEEESSYVLPLADVNCYSYSSGWSPVPPMNVGRYTPAASEFCGKLYVAGGASTKRLNDVECFDPKTNIWTVLAPMEKRRDEFILCIIDHKLFAVGGEWGSDQFDGHGMETYDADTEEWSILENLEGCRFDSLCSVAHCFELDELNALEK
ncbi:kelch-like protein 30 [Styela clava]